MEVNKSASETNGDKYKRYFDPAFQLLPEPIRPEKRKGFKAYDGTNNVFNFTYEMLSWKVHRALIKAKLEPYLGFLHSIQYGKPSLVCDFMELHRYIIDDFWVEYCRKLSPREFTVKTENLTKKEKRKTRITQQPINRRIDKSIK